MYVDGKCLQWLFLYMNILRKIAKTTATTFIRCIDARFEEEIGFITLELDK